METKRGGGIQKLPIEALHENFKTNLLFIFILEDRCEILLLRISFFFFLQKLEKTE